MVRLPWNLITEVRVDALMVRGGDQDGTRLVGFHDKVDREWATATIVNSNRG